jgi:ferredoxin-NADP reductase
MLTADVVCLELTEVDGADLPTWTPGAHIDVMLPNDITRQYSLCGDVNDRRSYRIAILDEPNGRGGSRAIHDKVEVGTDLELQGPRNHFDLKPAGSYLFIAGGIGITPILPMIADASARDIPWRLIYGGRNRGTMAFLPELERYGDSVELVPQDTNGLIDVGGLLGEVVLDRLVYCCGPEGLLEAVESATQTWPLGSLQVERFSARPLDPAHDDTTFEIELRSSGQVLTVHADESILAVVNDAGADVPSSCEEGLCGTCETGFLSGQPDHRDSVMSPQEHDDTKTIQICVSRSLSKRLVLDL